jgi:hypothetical protein
MREVHRCIFHPYAAVLGVFMEFQIRDSYFHIADVLVCKWVGIQPFPILRNSLVLYGHRSVKNVFTETYPTSCTQRASGECVSQHKVDSLK